MLRFCLLLAVLLPLGCRDEAPRTTAARPEPSAAPPADASGYYDRALEHENAGDYELADADYTRAYQLDSTNADYAYAMASIWLERQQYADAERILQRLVDPDAPRYALLLAQVELARGRYARALELLSPLTTETTLMRADAYYLIGEVEAARGDTTAALEAYRRIDLVDRQYLSGNYRAGELLLERGQPTEAYREFNIVVNNDPANVSARYLRGYASELMGRGADAVNDYEAVLRMEPTFSEAREALDRVSR